MSNRESIENSLKEFTAQELKDLEAGKNHLKKFDIEVDVAKKLREPVVKAVAEHNELVGKNNRIEGEMRQLQIRLKILNAEVQANRSKMKFITLTAIGQRDAWLKEVDHQLRQPLMHVKDYVRTRVIYELFGDTFLENNDVSVPGGFWNYNEEMNDA